MADLLGIGGRGDLPGPDRPDRLITPTQLKNVPRRIGVAGGEGKLAAIDASLKGG